LLERNAWSLAIDELVPMAHWITPAIEPRRFDTRFFLTRVPVNQTPTHDTHETTESVWLTPRAALERDRTDDIILPLPTWRTLFELSPCATVAAAREYAIGKAIRAVEPQFVEEDGRQLFVLPGDPLFTGTDRTPPEFERGTTRFLVTEGRLKAIL
jgi:hypothetical protein